MRDEGYNIFALISCQMGIDGLLNLLKPVVDKEHLSSFRGKKVAVDAKIWLYKGCYGYTFELNQELQTNQYMYYVFQMIQLLKYYQIDILLVFDGRSLDMKADTNEKRRKSKEENYQKGLKSLQNDDYFQAQKYFARCIKIDERIFSTALNCFRTKGVKFMIAPYQADSQIAKLYQLGEVDYVISEDSDFLVYGCKVLLKLTQTGDCDYIDLAKVDKEEHKDNPPLYNFLNLGYEDRVNACVLAGCDYLSNIRGIGLRTAVGLLKKYGTVDGVVSELRKNKKMEGKIADGYQDLVRKAQMVFLLAKVYNPITSTLEYLRVDSNPNHLALQGSDLDSIVGRDYQYTKDVQNGSVDCNLFNKRQIQTVNVKTLFQMDDRNLKMQELRFRLFKKQNVKNEFTEEEIEEARQLEEKGRAEREAREKKKGEEKEIRKNQLNQFLNSLMYLADEFDEEEEKEKRKREKGKGERGGDQEEDESENELSLESLIEEAEGERGEGEGGEKENQKGSTNRKGKTESALMELQKKQDNEGESSDYYYQNLNPFLIKK